MRHWLRQHCPELVMEGLLAVFWPICIVSDYWLVRFLTDIFTFYAFAIVAITRISAMRAPSSEKVVHFDF